MQSGSCVIAYLLVCVNWCQEITKICCRASQESAVEYWCWNANVRTVRCVDHVTAALIDLHRLPVAARIEYKLCTLVYQSVTGNAPTYITDMLQPVPDLDRLTQLRSASKGNLVVPRSRLKLGERAFRVAAPRLWNELPPDIRKSSTLATFKKHLKTFLFCKHYGLVLEQ